MSTAGKKRQGLARWQKAVVLMPVALLVGAWTASLGSAETTSASDSSSDPTIPSVPTTSFDEPASYTTPPSLDPSSFVTSPDDSSTDPGSTGADPSSESANGIPDAALAAYQRSQAVLDQADSACNIPWELIAAIGRVESDHGRYGGNILDDEGQSTPGIFGIPLDGTNDTALITDTDNGDYDNDPIYDRAVGAMQFIPSTWDIVGVDGDTDGTRDPQDIDDSALAAGVYLCAGDNDLSTTEGQRNAVFSYNHSDTYVNLVLAIMGSYADGDFTAIDNGLPSDDPVIEPAPAPEPGHHTPGHHHHGHHGHHGPSHQAPGGSHHHGGNSPVPGHHGGNNPGGVDPTDPNGPTGPVQTPADPVVVATAKCNAAFADAGIDPSGQQLQTCIAAYQDGGMAAVNTLIRAILDQLDTPDPPDLPLPPVPSVPVPGLPGSVH